MSILRLIQLEGHLRFGIRPGRRYLVGRSPACDLVIPDPAVSRRHAELRLEGGRLQLRDLDSANGTAVNGRRVNEGSAEANDVVEFGTAAFRLAAPEAAASMAEEGQALLGEVRPVTGILPTREEGRIQRILDRLLDVAADLSADLPADRLGEAVIDLAHDQIAADRVALLLPNHGTEVLEVSAWRNRFGELPPEIPRAIVERALADLVPVITDNAQEDERFQSGSVKLQAVRSALCVPLLGPGDQVLGALYADTQTRETAFTEDEARMFHGFAGMVGAAIGRIRFAEEARRERAARASLERFFAPDVAAAIAADEHPAALDGSRRTVAVLFCDIRGFSALAEQLDPEDTAALLGEYLSATADVVFDHGGTLDRFIGDAVLAVWGAPLEVPDAAERALGAARAMRRELTELSSRRAVRGLPPIEAGFGLAWGEVFAGNIGTVRRLEYTVVGDPVNVAARLCDMAAPGEIVLSADLAAQLPEQPAGTPDQVAIRGRATTVRIVRLPAEGS